MLKTLLKQTKGYRLISLLSPLLIVVEVYMEVQIPFVMADMVNNGILGGAGIEYILKEGGKMVVMASFPCLQVQVQRGLRLRRVWASAQT